VQWSAHSTIGVGETLRARATFEAGHQLAPFGGQKQTSYGCRMSFGKIGINNSVSRSSIERV